MVGVTALVDGGTAPAPAGAGPEVSAGHKARWGLDRRGRLRMVAAVAAPARLDGDQLEADQLP
jgi:hypothetical protein